MHIRLGVVLLLAGLASFPADTSQTLHQRYGQPILEAYLTRPDVAVAARYGPSQHVCAITIYPEHPKHPLNSRENSIGNDKRTREMLSELVPETERGKYLMGTFLDVYCGGPDQDVDCMGVEEDWEKLKIARMGNMDAVHYATIHWKRDECKDLYTGVE